MAIVAANHLAGEHDVTRMVPCLPRQLGSKIRTRRSYSIISIFVTDISLSSSRRCLDGQKRLCSEIFDLKNREKSTHENNNSKIYQSLFSESQFRKHLILILICKVLCIKHLKQTCFCDVYSIRNKDLYYSLNRFINAYISDILKKEHD